MVVMLNQCCCGCTLRTGTIIIGVLNSIFAVCTLIQGVVQIIIAAAQDNSDWHYLYERQPGLECAVGPISLLFGTLDLVMGVLLVLGANKDQKHLVKWWLMFNAPLMVMSMLAVIAILIPFLIWSAPVEAFVLLLIFSFMLCLAMYFLLVVYSYYRLLKEQGSPVTYRA